MIDRPLTTEEFEALVHEAYESLPERFRNTIDNVHVAVEDRDDRYRRRRAGVRAGSRLLGLYEGVPLTKRGTDYGMFPVVPDRVTLFKENIEAVCATPDEVRRRVREVLIHEIGHYYGMSEREIREAGF